MARGCHNQNDAAQSKPQCRPATQHRAYLRQTHTHNQRGRSGQAGDKIHRGIRLRVGPCKTEEYYAGKNGGACLDNL